MKKIILLCMVALIAVTSNAQKADFRLQNDGTFQNIDGSKYIVIAYNNISKSDLYNKVLASISQLYVSPHDVISKVNNELITIDGISENCITLGKGLMAVRFSIEYNLQFQFKDNKIRIEAPYIVRLFTYNNPDIKPFSGWLNAQNIFKKGLPNPKKQTTIDDFNITVNNAINGIIEFKSNDNW